MKRESESARAQRDGSGRVIVNVVRTVAAMVLAVAVAAVSMAAPAASDFSLPPVVVPALVASSTGPATPVDSSVAPLPPVVAPPLPVGPVPGQEMTLPPPPLPSAPLGSRRVHPRPDKIVVPANPALSPAVDEVLPRDLLRIWQSLTKAASAGDEAAIASLARPFAISVNRHERAPSQADHGRDINMPFLKLGFSPDIAVVRKDADDAWLIRTRTTACWFKKTVGGWVLERYLDKPIE